MHLFRIWFQRLPDIRNFAVYFLALWPMFQLIPTLRENSCAKPVLRANLWVKFRYSGIGFFGVWGLFLAYKNEITWTAPEHTFSHYCHHLLSYLWEWRWLILDSVLRVVIVIGRVFGRVSFRMARIKVGWEVRLRQLDSPRFPYLYGLCLSFYIYFFYNYVHVKGLIF